MRKLISRVRAREIETVGTVERGSGEAIGIEAVLRYPAPLGEGAGADAGAGALSGGTAF